MKNLKYFPYERNRYFYGKFLSVDDFEAEQRYMNDKRRLLNRFLHGCGVVCGLQVVEVDDLTILVEAGIALDFSGREIVVASPVTKRLSAIEGYSGYEEGEERREMYLCIAYAEESVEPVHNITRVNEEQGEEHNKYAEGYRLFITGEEPEQEGLQSALLYEDSQTVFQGDGIRIRQAVPKYIQRGSESEIIITVEKNGQSLPVSFSYQLQLTHLEQQGGTLLTVEFDELKLAAADTYEIRESIRAKAVAGIDGSVEAVPGSFTLAVGQDRKKADIKGKFRVRIVEGGIAEAVKKSYYQASMEDIMKDVYGGAIYLAKLEVIQAGNTYVVERIENLPYQQLVWNGMLSENLEMLRQRRTDLGIRYGVFHNIPEKSQSAEKSEQGGESPQGLPFLRQSGPQTQIQTGCAVIHLGIGGAPGKRFYSEEIVHGLGLGEVFISLGLAEGVQQEGQVIFGSQDIFRENAEPNILLAAKADPKKGSFVIGIKCLEEVKAKRLQVCWMAVKNREQGEEKVRRMELRPNMANVKVRESCFFEAAVENEVQRHVEWSVKEPDGGTIDKNGCYTAPNQSGVYEIIAESMEEKLHATAYVLVRDEF